MEKREAEPKAVEAVRVGCIDENDIPGKKVVKIGVPGTGVTALEGGNEVIYPINERKNIADAVKFIFEWVNEFSQNLGVGSFSSSHPECAAVGAQGVLKEADVVIATEILSSKFGTDYAGHLVFSLWPRKIGNSNIPSWFDRRKGQPHEASSINITVGGGITGSEKETLERETKGTAFDISADWINNARNKGFPKEKIVQALLFQFKLAYSIAENVRNNKDPFKIFDAGRLEYGVTDENMSIVKDALFMARREISQGNWKAASHH